MTMPSQLHVNALNRLVTEHKLYIQEMLQQQQDYARTTNQYEARKLQELTAETTRMLQNVRDAIVKQIDVVAALSDADAHAAVERARTYLAQ